MARFALSEGWFSRFKGLSAANFTVTYKVLGREKDHEKTADYRCNIFLPKAFTRNN
jgi:hypothetical protein